MSAIVSIVAGLFGKLIAPIFKLVEMWTVHRAGRKQGMAEERNRQHEEWQQHQAKVDRAGREADSRTDDDVRRRLRESATDRPSGPSGPV